MSNRQVEQQIAALESIASSLKLIVDILSAINGVDAKGQRRVAISVDINEMPTVTVETDGYREPQP